MKLEHLAVGVKSRLFYRVAVCKRIIFPLFS